MLYIIRHAEAHDVGERDIERDEDRMLTDKGKKHSRRIGKVLSMLGDEPDVLLSSPLVRARETTEEIAKKLKNEPQMLTCDALSPPGNTMQLLAYLNDLAEGVDSIALVGHEPFLGGFLQELLNNTGTPTIPLSKSTVVQLKWTLAEPAKLGWIINRKLAKAMLRD